MRSTYPKTPRGAVAARSSLLLAALLLLWPAATLAADIELSHELADIVLDDPFVVRAIVSVTVVNGAGQELKNVDLRPAGPFAVAEGVLQVGQLPADEARTVSGEILISADAFATDNDLFWTVDFDDEQGAHQQLDAASSEAR